MIITISKLLRAILITACAVCAVVAWGKKDEVIAVQTLTRHGSRAPNRALARESCIPLLDSNRDGKDEFSSIFGVRPSELTRRGVQEMRDVGRYLRERYEQMGLIFGDYLSHTRDFLFIARQGDRQQRSIMGVAQGMFPDDAVPIQVTDRENDVILSAPPPICAEFTSNMIVKWHATTGRQYVKQHYAQLVPFEKLCNYSLLSNPVDVQQGGGNPHAAIGDISDLMDALNLERNEPMPITNQQLQDITKIAFDLEQGSHFEDGRGAGVFLGDFADDLLSTFEKIMDGSVTPGKNHPKMKLSSCSRELFYALENVFLWNSTVEILPGQPKGRIVAGTTFIWELTMSGMVNSYYYQIGYIKPKPLQPPMSLVDYRRYYAAYVSAHGKWRDVCLKKNDNSDVRSSNVAANGDGDAPLSGKKETSNRPSRSAYNFMLVLIGLAIFALVYKMFMKKRGDYNTIA